jgi:serpin B
MKTSIAALVLASFAAIACTSTEEDAGEVAVEVARSSLAREIAPTLEAAEAETFANDQAGFAVDLYHAVAKASAGEDVFLSPHSVSTALAMTYAGARGATRDEMKEVLHFGLPDERLHTAFNWLDLELASRGQGSEGKDGQPFRLNVVNSTWGQKGFAFEAPFLDTLAVNYGAGVNLLDFRTDAESSRLIINRWVEGKTEKRITDLLPEGSLNHLTRMVLVNAVYFNAGWASKFQKDATVDAAFTRLDGSSATVSMMKSQATRGYVAGDGYEATLVDYDGGEMGMLVVAPTSGTFDTFESELTGERVLGILAGLESREVVLSLPKFKLDAGLSLKEPLKALGMTNAFEEADFSGISTQEELQIKDVFHKTFLEIDEDGTEAAAATAVIIGERTSAPVDPPTVMTVDRPFLVAIVDRKTSTLVFFGRILEPKL